MLKLVMENTVSFMNKLKRKIERWSLWGTLEVTFIETETKFLYLSNWVCWHKNS